MMEKIFALVLYGETVTMSGIILILWGKLLEVSVGIHTARILPVTIVLTRMEISTLMNIPLMKMEVTMLPSVGEIP
jgi:hypothetical protein